MADDIDPNSATHAKSNQERALVDGASLDTVSTKYAFEVAAAALRGNTVSMKKGGGFNSHPITHNGAAAFHHFGQYNSARILHWNLCDAHKWDHQFRDR